MILYFHFVIIHYESTDETFIHLKRTMTHRRSHWQTFSISQQSEMCVNINRRYFLHKFQFHSQFATRHTSKTFKKKWLKSSDQFQPSPKALTTGRRTRKFLISSSLSTTSKMRRNRHSWYHVLGPLRTKPCGTFAIQCYRRTNLLMTCQRFFGSNSHPKLRFFESVETSTTRSKAQVKT